MGLPTFMKVSKRYLRSKKYRKLILEGWRLDRIAFETGPYCNLGCKECYAKCTTDTSERINVKTVKKAAEDLKKVPVMRDMINRVLLSDGEPLLAINKPSLEAVLKEFQDKEIHILTNCSFARTDENTVAWFRWLQDNGYDFNKNVLSFSSGTIYPFKPSRHGRIARSLIEAVPNIKFDENIFWSFIFSTNEDRDEVDKLYGGIISGIIDAVGYVKEKEVEPVVSNVNNSYNVYIPAEKGLIRVSSHVVSPVGGGKDSVPADPNLEKLMELRPNTRFRRYSEGIWVSHDGDVGLGITKYDIAPGLIFGNLFEKDLPDIVIGAIQTPFYKANSLGQVSFMYWTLKKLNPGIKRPKKHFTELKEIVYTKENVDILNEYYSNHDIEEAYLEYLSEVMPVGKK